MNICPRPHGPDHDRSRPRAARGLALALAPVCLLLMTLGCGTLGSMGAGDDLVHVVFVTEKGNIEVALDRGRAPMTVNNFLYYVDGGFYTGGDFFRTVKPDNQPDNKIKIQVIQAEINPARQDEEAPPIKLERTSVTGIHHTDGTLSMPRWGPDTGTSGFSITIGRQPSMDYGGMRNPDGQGFAAFGHVVKGMDVVHAIQQSPARGQNLTPKIRILRAYRVIDPIK